MHFSSSTSIRSQLLSIFLSIDHPNIFSAIKSKLIILVDVFSLMLLEMFQKFKCDRIVISRRVSIQVESIFRNFIANNWGFLGNRHENSIQSFLFGCINYSEGAWADTVWDLWSGGSIDSSRSCQPTPSPDSPCNSIRSKTNCTLNTHIRKILNLKKAFYLCPLRLKQPYANWSLRLIIITIVYDHVHWREW